MIETLVGFFLLTAVLVDGQGYDPDEAQMFASLSSVTYCESMDRVLDWTCGACAESKTRLIPGKIKIVDGGAANATRVLVGRLQDQSGCLVAFRGSDNLMNWIRDLQYYEVVPTTFEDCDGCKVHSGFYTIWKNVRDLVVNALQEIQCDQANNLLYVTGHSLGAALTHLAMFHFANAGFAVAKSYSYEAPRIGNKAFAAAFSDRFSRKFPVYRITNRQDPVVHLPPEAFGYSHVQTEVHYNSTGGYKVCDDSEDASSGCADSYWNIPGMLALHSGDHCASDLVPNGDICNPQGCQSSSTSFEIIA